jgi:hypothetical protein
VSVGPGRRKGAAPGDGGKGPAAARGPRRAAGARGACPRGGAGARKPRKASATRPASAAPRPPGPRAHPRARPAGRAASGPAPGRRRRGGWGFAARDRGNQGLADEGATGVACSCSVPQGCGRRIGPAERFGSGGARPRRAARAPAARRGRGAPGARRPPGNPRGGQLLRSARGAPRRSGPRGKGRAEGRAARAGQGAPREVKRGPRKTVRPKSVCAGGPRQGCAQGLAAPRGAGGPAAFTAAAAGAGRPGSARQRRRDWSRAPRCAAPGAQRKDVYQGLCRAELGASGIQAAPQVHGSGASARERPPGAPARAAGGPAASAFLPGRLATAAGRAAALALRARGPADCAGRGVGGEGTRPLLALGVGLPGVANRSERAARAAAASAEAAGLAAGCPGTGRRPAGGDGEPRAAAGPRRVPKSGVRQFVAPAARPAPAARGARRCNCLSRGDCQERGKFSSAAVAGTPRGRLRGRRPPPEQSRGRVGTRGRRRGPAPGWRGAGGRPRGPSSGARPGGKSPGAARGGAGHRPEPAAQTQRRRVQESRGGGRPCPARGRAGRGGPRAARGPEAHTHGDTRAPPAPAYPHRLCSTDATSWLAISTCTGPPRSARQNSPGPTAWHDASAPDIIWIE